MEAMASSFPFSSDERPRSLDFEKKSDEEKRAWRITRKWVLPILGRYSSGEGCASREKMRTWVVPGE